MVNEGEANELAWRRAATVEGKKLMKVEHEEDDLTEAEEDENIITKLKGTGNYSVQIEKKEGKELFPRGNQDASILDIWQWHNCVPRRRRIRYKKSVSRRITMIQPTAPRNKWKMRKR